MSGEITFKLFGDREVERMFSDLPAAAQKNVLDPLMRKASKLIASIEASSAPRESGLLQASLGASALKKYGSTLFVTVGVRRGFRRAITRGRNQQLRIRSKKYTAANTDAAVRNPVHYLHLVEHGREAVRAVNSKVLYSSVTDRYFGKSVVKARPQPFMQQSFDVAKNTVVAMITAEAPDMIVAEAKKLGN